MNALNRSYVPTPTENADAMKAASEALIAFEKTVKTISPEHHELFLSVRGWLVTVYEQGWHDAKRQGK